MRLFPVARVPDAVFVLSASVLQRGSAFVLTISAVRHLAPSEFGAFGYGYATAVGLSAFFGDAISAAALREPDTKGGLAGPCGVVLSAYFGLAIVGAAALAGLTGLAAILGAENRSVGGTFAIVVLSFCLALSTSAFSILCRRGYRKHAAVCSIGGSAVILTGAIWPGGLPDASAYLWVSAVGVMATLACHLAHLSRKAGLDIRVSRSSIAGLRGERASFLAKTSAALALGGPVHWLCLTILASSGDGMVQVAIYAAFFQWYLVLTFLPSSLAAITVPWLAAGYSTKGGGELSRRLNRVLGYVLAVGGGVVAVAAFGAPTVAGLYGTEYAEHWPALVAAIACAVVAVLIAFGMQAYLASGRAGENLLATLVYSAQYLASTAILVGYFDWGALGLFTALLLASLVQLGLQHYLLARPAAKIGANR